MQHSIYLIATLDTKGHEAHFLRQRLSELSLSVTVVDVGCMGTPTFSADITREQVFAASEVSLDQLRDRADRGQAIAAAASGVASLLRSEFESQRVAGVIAIGGSAGTTIGTAAMRALPIGLPKLMVSTLASGQVRPYVGDKDIMMLNSVVDIAGINRISRRVLGNAAHAMAGMVSHKVENPPDDRPLIAATMFGVTTPCVQHARQLLENAGYEVLVFHATGSGGRAMESLIEDGLIAGVLDITTTELADELVGGVLSAGPDRLLAAARHGVPQVVSVGATDMVNFGAADTVPGRFAGRKFYQHNDTVTLMRTTAEENSSIGREIAQKVATSRGPATILLPLQGVSAIDQLGQPFDDPIAREALFASIRQDRGNLDIMELDHHINAPEFAEAAARQLLSLLTKPN
ncbi:MAG: Tm-1-like ATP-binding domain-containing protein [Planctomycetales bacterium]|nr:Tm-1-like ATP-binding domain-containing protein [Planctomycetales bacterium]